MIDDRVPIVLVVLDGLGDRACAELGGRTPAEAAATPVLDALAARGSSGVHVPFGWGTATSSEMSHWSMLGFETVPFPGRAALEALGVGLRPPYDTPLLDLALRTAVPGPHPLRLGRRAGAHEAADAAALFDALGGREQDGISFELQPIRDGEALLVAHGATSPDVSDTDALFPHLHPWMRPVPLAEAADAPEAARTAAALERWLLDSREILCDHPVNGRRRDQGLDVLDVPVTKWAGVLRDAQPSFEQQVGLRAGAVTSSALYRGLAKLLGMTFHDRRDEPGETPGDDIAARVALARGLLRSVDVVHVHTKAPDEAGHTKDPQHKQHVIESLDAGLQELHDLAEHCVVAVTGDHATPSTGALLHSGDPTPFVLVGPGVRADAVRSFGEGASALGTLARLAARDVMPLLAGASNRPFFRGHRPGPWMSAALPAAPAPMPSYAHVPVRNAHDAR